MDSSFGHLVRIGEQSQGGAPVGWLDDTISAPMGWLSTQLTSQSVQVQKGRSWGRCSHAIGRGGGPIFGPFLRLDSVLSTCPAKVMASANVAVRSSSRAIAGQASGRRIAHGRPATDRQVGR